MPSSLQRPAARPQPDLALVGAVAAAAVLRLLALGDRPLAPAELPMWSASASPWTSSVGGVSLPTLLATLVTSTADVSEFTVRLPSAAAGILLVAAIAPLARRLGGAPLARWAAWLAATSPYLVFYDRTATPLALTALLTLLANWWYLFLPTGRPRAVLGFAGTMFLLALTSGAVFPVAVAQAAFLWVRRAGTRAWLRWLAGIIVAFVGALATVVPFSDRVQVTVEPSSNVVTEAGALAFKVLSPLLAFALGETLSIGQPVGLAGLVVIIWLVGVGSRRLARPGRQFVFVFGLLPVFWTATLTATFGSPGAAEQVSARVGYAWPAFGLVVAAGVTGLSAGARRFAYAGLAAVAAFSLGGYAHGRDVAQPQYALPVDDVLSFIEARSEPGDVVLAESHSMLAHHVSRHRATLPVIDLRDADALRDLMAGEPPRRLWLATGPYDRRSTTPPEVDRWLADQYRSVERRSYATPDPTMAALKGWLLDSPAGDAGIMLTLFERR